MYWNAPATYMPMAPPAVLPVILGIRPTSHPEHVKSVVPGYAQVAAQLPSQVPVQVAADVDSAKAPEKSNRSRAARRRHRGGRNQKNRKNEQGCAVPTCAPVLSDACKATTAGTQADETPTTVPSTAPSAAEQLDLLAGPSPHASSRPPADAKAPSSPIPGGHAAFFPAIPAGMSLGPTPAELTLLQALGEPPSKDRDISQEQQGVAMARLEGGDKTEQRVVINWMLTAPERFAKSKLGTRIVQKALEVASGSDRDALVGKLQEHVVDLYEDPNANHVLTKIIEVIPSTSSSIGSVIAALRRKGTFTVSKHRFGCRVMERLLEHCDETQQPEFVALLDEVVADAGALSKNQMGNFVVQHLLEHGSPERRRTTLEQMLAWKEGIGVLAQHRTASHCVQRCLDYCEEAGKAALVEALLAGSGDASIISVAKGRYGSFVLEQIAGCSERKNEIRNALAEDVHGIAAYDWGKKVLGKYGLAIPQRDRKSVV